MVLWMNFYLIGWKPMVTLLLAGLAKRLVDNGKDRCGWGDGVKTNFVDYSVEISLTLFNFK